VHKGQIWANSYFSSLEAFMNSTPLRVVNSTGRHLLTERENEVANLVAQGMTNREIAGKLGVGEHTVSNYLFRIYEKLGISSRVELVLFVIHHKQRINREAPEVRSSLRSSRGAIGID
jgi:DNA-binding NarL/FixJ family response regulator